ncbi:hypothetical protein R1flu_020667 [Riccia fluitans]|uniref:Uncharacterized protein n=1 Tax=Riccia fluitans TaxID=41844 RepID=A0ABD1ZQM7_9MARC
MFVKGKEKVVEKSVEMPMRGRARSLELDSLPPVNPARHLGKRGSNSTAEPDVHAMELEDFSSKRDEEVEGRGQIPMGFQLQALRESSNLDGGTLAEGVGVRDIREPFKRDIATFVMALLKPSHMNYLSAHMVYFLEVAFARKKGNWATFFQSIIMKQMSDVKAKKIKFEIEVPKESEDEAKDASTEKLPIEEQVVHTKMEEMPDETDSHLEVFFTSEVPEASAPPRSPKAEEAEKKDTGKLSHQPTTLKLKPAVDENPKP